MFKKLIAVICILLSASCAHVRTDIAKDATITGYKRAYVKALPEDEFQIYRALFWEMNDLGMQVSSVPFDSPTDSDLEVTFSYEAGWDFVRYLQSFQLQFATAKTHQVVASTAYRSVGIWRGARDGRLEDAFNNIRMKVGAPPTRQFSQ